jgi:hypothetical protein
MKHIAKAILVATLTLSACDQGNPQHHVRHAQRTAVHEYQGLGPNNSLLWYYMIFANHGGCPCYSAVSTTRVSADSPILKYEPVAKEPSEIDNTKEVAEENLTPAETPAVVEQAEESYNETAGDGPNDSSVSESVSTSGESVSTSESSTSDSGGSSDSGSSPD